MYSKGVATASFVLRGCRRSGLAVEGRRDRGDRGEALRKQFVYRQPRLVVIESIRDQRVTIQKVMW
jgi:hypothetical protein